MRKLETIRWIKAHRFIMVIHTVVRIHINAATFAPIAQAPAMPPRAADAADFSTISRKDSCFFAGVIDVSLLLMINNAIRALFVCI